MAVPYPKRAQGLELAPMDDGYILHEEARDRVHYLNPTAAAVWQLCVLEPPPPDDVSPCTLRGLRPALRAVTYSNIQFRERGREISTSPTPTTVSATFSKPWWVVASP